MSYDLYLYKKKDSYLTEDKVAEYLTNNLPFSNHESPKEWVYENPETGVYFVIEWNEPDTDAESIDIFENFADYDYLHFNVSVNFIRPQYFALEAFPVIDKIIDDLDLFILNSQDETDPNNPLKFPAGYFCDQWIRHNDGLSAEHFKELDLKYMPPEKSNGMWRFSFRREALQEKLGEGTFVAGFFVIESAEDGSLNTVSMWPEHIPIVLAPCDYIIIKKKYKSFFRDVEESGFVSYETVMNELGHYFDNYEDAGAGVKILTQNNADAMAKSFNKLKIIKATEEFGKMIAKDKFVNALPR